MDGRPNRTLPYISDTAVCERTAMKYANLFLQDAQLRQVLCWSTFQELYIVILRLGVSLNGHFLKRYSGLILEPPSFHSCPKTPCIMKWKLIKAPFNCSRQQFSGSGCKCTAWWLIVLKCGDQRNTHTWLNSFPWRLHPPANTIFPELVFRYFHNLCTDRKLNFPLKITADVSLVLSFTLETD